MVDGVGVNQSALTFSTRINATTLSERMRINSSGNIGIGTANPGVKLTTQGINGAPSTSGTAQSFGGLRIENQANSFVLDFGINGGNSWLQATDKSNLATFASLLLNPNGGNVGIGTMNPTYQLQLSTDSAGKPNGGSWANSSDERIKKNITPITDALEKIVSLRGVQYEWRNPSEHAARDGEIRAGFLAQEVENVFPKFVNEIDASKKDAILTPNGKIKNLSLPFDFDAYIVEAIKELKKENDELRAKIGKLENK